MDAALERIIQAIVEYKEPSRIILFGSKARKEGRPDSDTDVCVLYDSLPGRNLEVLQELYAGLYRRELNSVDLVVYDETSFADRAGRRNSLEANILEEGIPVYGPA